MWGWFERGVGWGVVFPFDFYVRFGSLGSTLLPNSNGVKKKGVGRRGGRGGGGGGEASNGWVGGRGGGRGVGADRFQFFDRFSIKYACYK